MGSIRKWFAEQCIVRKGKNRIVLDLVRSDIVIKLPIIHLVRFRDSIKGYMEGTSIIPFSMWIKYPMHSNGFWGLKRALFKGILDNWGEFWFFLTERHPFAQPTYFSLFGLVNIQKKGGPVEVDGEAFYRDIFRLVGPELFEMDMHHIAFRVNFCASKGRLKILDYGSPKTRQVIRERGMCVYNNFQVDR